MTNRADSRHQLFQLSISGGRNGRLFAALAVLVWILPAGRAQISLYKATAVPSHVDTTVTVLLTDHGFPVPHLYLKKGMIAMLIQNKSRLPQVTIQITHSGGTAPDLNSVHSPTQRDNAWFFDIQPGDYTISTVQNPAWKAILTASAN
jgi:hypothetical protein